MDILSVCLLLIVGLCVGSFLTVVVDRLPKRENIMWGHSHCEHCRHMLHAWDLIPVVSFLVLGGKCRYCHKNLSWYYPAIELTTCGLFLLTALLYHHNPITLLYMLFVVSVLIVIFFTDLKYGLIPFKVVIPTEIVIILYTLFINPASLPMVLLAGMGAFLFFFFLYHFTHGRGMGFGDVMYVGLMGLLLGFSKSILGLYIAFLTGALAAVILIVIKRKKFSGGTIPFGPFLVLGTIIGLYWGNSLVASIITWLFPI